MKNRTAKIVLVLLLIILLIIYTIYRLRNIDSGFGRETTSQSIKESKIHKVFISEYTPSQKVIEGKQEKYGIKEVWSEWIWLFKDQDLTVEKTNKIQLLIALDKPVQSVSDISYFKNPNGRPGGYYNTENLVISLGPDEDKIDTITVFFLAKKDTIPIYFVKKK